MVYPPPTQVRSRGTEAATAARAPSNASSSEGRCRSSRASSMAASERCMTSWSVHQRERSSRSHSSRVSGHWSADSSTAAVAGATVGRTVSSCRSTTPGSTSGAGATSGRPSRRRATRTGRPSARWPSRRNCSAMRWVVGANSSITTNCPLAAVSARAASRMALACTERVSVSGACQPPYPRVRRTRRSAIWRSTSAASTGAYAATAGGIADSSGAAASTSAGSRFHWAIHQPPVRLLSEGTTRPAATSSSARRCMAPNHATEGLTPSCSVSS
ncbi:MAG: hypothetical protein RI900_2439 [Actinomycetota bacterium]